MELSLVSSLCSVESDAQSISTAQALGCELCVTIDSLTESASNPDTVRPLALPFTLINHFAFQLESQVSKLPIHPVYHNSTPSMFGTK